MRNTIILLGLLFFTAGASSGICAQLGSGPESIMGFSANETILYSSLEEEGSLSFTQSAPVFSSMENDGDLVIPSFSVDYTGKGTDNFYHLSLINRDDDFHGLLGLTYEAFNIITHYGISDGSVSDRLNINGVAPNFFHGSVSYPYDYGGSTLGISLSEDLTLHGGATFIDAEGLEGRSVYYSGLSFKGFYATFNHVKRGDEAVGHSVITGLDVGTYSISYQELKSAYDATWREVSVGFSDNEKLRKLKVSLGIGDNEYYYAGDDTRLTVMYSIPLGGKKYSRINKGASFSATSSELAKSSSTFQELKKTSLGSVGSVLSLSAGEEILDGKGQKGFRFKYKWPAARTILSRWNPVSIDMNKEIAGTIYRNRDGTFGINSNVRLGTNDSAKVFPWTDIPRGTKPAAIWHTHGAYDPRYGVGNEIFSYQDIGYFNRWKVDGYLGTPKGRMWWYERKAGLERYTDPGYLPTN